MSSDLNKKQPDAPQGLEGSGIKIRSVKYNVVMNMILTASSYLFPLITIPYVSRVLSTTGTGAVAFAQSFAQYFSLVALFGISYYGIRACAQVRDDIVELTRTTKEILIILFASTLLVSAVYVAVILTLPRFTDDQPLFLIFLAYIWFTSLGAEWFFQGIEQYRYITIRSVAFKAIAFVLMILLVRERADYVVYGAILVFSVGGSAVLNLIRLFRIIDRKSKCELHPLRHFKEMKWFAIALISSGMYIHVDIVMLGFFGTTHMVGLYNLVSKIKTVLVSSVNSVGGVMLPRLSHYRATGDSEASRILIAKNVNFVFIMGFGIIALLLLCAEPIVLIMGGHDFIDSTIPLMVVGPAVLFSAMNIVIANHLISEGYEKQWAAVNVIGLVLACLLNVVLIPLFGVIGAAISITSTEFLMLIMRSIVCRRFLSTILALIDPLKILVATVITALVTYGVLWLVGVDNPIIVVLIAGCVFLALYAALLYALKEKLVRELMGGFIARVKRKASGS